MESSSNDSFAWTEASEGRTDSSEMALENNTISQSDEDSEFCKKYKEKLHEELFADNQINQQQKGTKRTIKNKTTKDEKNDSPKKKKIKTEPESDNEIPKNKYKSSKSDKSGQISKDLLLSDESYLNMRVKEEMILAPLTVVTPKKNKSSTDTQINVNNEVDVDLPHINANNEQKNSFISCFDTSEGHQITNSEESFNKTKKKKKKKTKIRNNSIQALDELDYVNIEDKHSSEDAVLETHNLCNNIVVNDSLKGSLIDSSKKRTSSQNSDVDVYVNGITDQIHNEAKIKILESEVSSEEDQDVKQAYNKDNLETKLNNNKFEKSNPRISDRIGFEDEDNFNNDISSSAKDIELRSKKLDKFVKVNVNLKPLSRKLDNNSVITLDDEIWVLKCSNDVNVEAFQDITIPLDKKCKFKIEGNTFEGNFENNSACYVTVLSQAHSQFVLKKIHSNGTINICKRVPKVHIHYDTMMLNNEPDFVSLPDTKVRHPLFGSNYKKAIKLSTSIKNKLAARNDQITSDEFKKQNKQKKSKKCIKNDESELVHHDNNTSEDSITKKKSRKRKASRLEQPSQDNEPKRKKHNSDPADVWDSEKAIEESLFNF